MSRDEKRSGIADFFCFIRDGVSYVFSWLIICVILFSVLTGNTSVSIEHLVWIFLLGLWAVVSFFIAFRWARVQEKGFICSLTVFYSLFIPIELILFYIMGIFKEGQNRIPWIVFGVIIACFYAISVGIEVFVMRKRSRIYTEKMNAYNQCADEN